MASIRLRFIAALLFFLTADLVAQDTSLVWLQRVLPAGAQVIESAKIQSANGKDRSIVLWMLRPKRVYRHLDSLACSDWVYGDHWQGAARLSVIDDVHKQVINTIELRSSRAATGTEEDELFLPFYVAGGYYFVPSPVKPREGVPTLLPLRDLTGEGIQGQFVLFEHGVCGTPYTAVFGYSPASDSVRHFSVESIESGQLAKETASWLMHTFGQKPSNPGKWDFSWEPGHGCNCLIHERVAFDRERQLFVRKWSSTQDRPVKRP